MWSNWNSPSPLWVCKGYKYFGKRFGSHEKERMC